MTSSGIHDVISSSFHCYCLRHWRLWVLFWRYKDVSCQVHVTRWASLVWSRIILVDLLHILVIQWWRSHLFERWLIWSVEDWFGNVWWRHTRRTRWHVSVTSSNLREILLPMLELGLWLFDLVSVIADEDIITVNCLLHLLIIYDLVKLFSMVLVHIMAHFAPFTLRHVITTWLTHRTVVLVLRCMLWSLLKWWSTANGRMSLMTLILHALLLMLDLVHDAFLLDH